jgi:hypothetical protein
MQLSELEQTLRGMIEAEEARNAPPPKRPTGWRSRLLRLRRAAPSTPPGKPAAGKRKGPRPSDIAMAVLGAGLGVGCALFPWYIFFNPDQFGVRAMKFSGSSAQHGPIELGLQPDRVGAPMSVDDIPPMQLDLFATGTVKPLDEEGDGGGQRLNVIDQPFPGDEIQYRLVYAASGRAMIADEAGLWVVERGSLLPDNSHVADIVQRDGAWMLVTSTDRVVPLTP